MPGTKTEKARDQAILRELQAQGIDVGELEDEELPVDIEVGTSIENFIFEQRAGSRAHYAISLQLTAKVTSVVILDCKISSPFDSDILPESGFGQEVIFDFCGQHFLRKDILNQRIETGLRFNSRGQVIQGWVLGSGLRPIPQELRSERCTWCQLTFFDSLGRKAQAKAPLSVLRSTRLPEQIPQSEVGLYAGPIPGPDFEEEVHLSLLELRAEEKVQKENPGATLAEQERLTQELFKKMCADRQKMKLEYTNSLLARAARVAQ